MADEAADVRGVRRTGCARTVGLGRAQRTWQPVFETQPQFDRWQRRRIDRDGCGSHLAWRLRVEHQVVGSTVIMAGHVGVSGLMPDVIGAVGQGRLEVCAALSIVQAPGESRRAGLPQQRDDAQQQPMPQRGRSGTGQGASGSHAGELTTEPPARRNPNHVLCGHGGGTAPPARPPAGLRAASHRGGRLRRRLHRHRVRVGAQRCRRCSV